MPLRRCVVMFICLALASCSTSSNLSRRELSEGISRTFPGEFVRVSAAVDHAIETLPVNIVTPIETGNRRIVRFNRPMTTSGWGENGRVVVTRVGADTTRVTVAVSSWDPVARTENDYAAQIFREVQESVVMQSGMAGAP